MTNPTSAPADKKNKRAKHQQTAFEEENLLRTADAPT